MTGLANKVIISTRPVSNDDAIKNYLEEKGAVVLDLPLIEIAPSPISENIKNALQHLDSYNWLIFTSRNGVECFFKALELINSHSESLDSIKGHSEPLDSIKGHSEPLDSIKGHSEPLDSIKSHSESLYPIKGHSERSDESSLSEIKEETGFVQNDPESIIASQLKDVKIAAFGEKTGREVSAHGFEPCFVSKANTSSDFLQELLEYHISQGDKVLLSLGELAKTTLEDGLSKVAEVTRIDVYRTIEARSYPVEIIDRIKNNKYDLILFTSPSGFVNFIKIMTDNGCAIGFRIACIGRTTEKEVVRHGYEPLLVSSKPEGTVFAMEIEKLLNN